MRPLIFYYFLSCEGVSSAVFPNAYIGFFDINETYGQLALLSNQDYFSVYSFEPKLTSWSSDNQNYMYVAQVPTTGRYASLDQMEIYCHKLVVVQFEFQKDVPYCKRDKRFLYYLKIYFNLSLTNDITKANFSSGQLHNLVILPDSDKQWLSSYCAFTEILNDASLSFMYCLPKHASLLLTIEALVAPFDLWTWIGLGVTFILLLFVRLQSKSKMGRIKKVLYNIGLLLEQSLPGLSSWSILICMSFFVITTIYKMRVTSDLLVPTKAQPPKNISSLLQKGYTMVYHPTLQNVIASVKIVWHLHAYNLVASNPAYEDFRTTIFLAVLDKLQAKIYPQRFEVHLSNMSCFATESNVGMFQHSLSFFHPWYKRMKSFTRTFFEAGELRLFWNLDRNFHSLSSREGSNKKSKESFIKFKEAKTIFIICLSFLLAGIAVFAIENLQPRFLYVRCRLRCTAINFRV